MQCRNINLRDNLENIFSYSSFARYLQLDCSIKDILELEKEEVEKVISKALEKLKEAQKWYYFNILDEFILKGFNICKLVDKSKLCGLKSENYIRVELDRERYKKIQWSKLGIEDVNTYFNVKSDYFFNYITPEVFKHFNEELSSEEIEDFFLNYDFIIEKVERKFEDSVISGEETSSSEKTSIDNGKIIAKNHASDKNEKVAQGERVVSSEELFLLEKELLETKTVFLDRNQLEDKYKVDISLHLKGIIIVTENEVAHLDKIHLSLSEEAELIKIKEDVNNLEFDELENKFSKFFKRNTEVDSKEKVISIIKMLQS